MVTTWHPFLPLNNCTSEMRNVCLYRVCVCVGVGKDGKMEKWLKINVCVWV